MTKNSKLSRQSLLILLLALFSSCTPPGPEVKNEGMPNWCRVYFTPRDPVVERMISLIDNARERVWAAFYSFTLDISEIQGVGR